MAKEITIVRSEIKEVTFEVTGLTPGLLTHRDCREDPDFESFQKEMQED